MLFSPHTAFIRLLLSPLRRLLSCTTLVYPRPPCCSFAFWLERRTPSESLPKVAQRSASPVFSVSNAKGQWTISGSTIADINIELASQVARFSGWRGGDKSKRCNRGASGFLSSTCGLSFGSASRWYPVGSSICQVKLIDSKGLELAFRLSIIITTSELHYCAHFIYSTYFRVY